MQQDLHWWEVWEVFFLSLAWELVTNGKRNWLFVVGGIVKVTTMKRERERERHVLCIWVVGCFNLYPEDWELGASVFSWEKWTLVMFRLIHASFSTMPFLPFVLMWKFHLKISHKFSVVCWWWSKRLKKKKKQLYNSYLTCFDLAKLFGNRVMCWIWHTIGAKICELLGDLVFLRIGPALTKDSHSQVVSQPHTRAQC